MGESAPPIYPQKSKPTKWSAYSVINPPGRYPVPSDTLASINDDPGSYAPPVYKITGSRDSYLSRPSPHPTSTTSTTTPTHVPAFHTAPFATSTPVPSTAQSQQQQQQQQQQPPPPTSIPKHLRGSLHAYNPHMVGLRSGSKSQYAANPMDVYRFPPSHAMEYGWRWDGRSTLEIYGSTSADFARESWKFRAGRM
ncbi:hypothetical protein BC831DRAFT_483785 [Entophlyctis helioformis]|nr:hypothetical protein BC831DRAFT_483785 [Entophlyctis helioformis]